MVAAGETMVSASAMRSTGKEQLWSEDIDKEGWLWSTRTGEVEEDIEEEAGVRGVGLDSVGADSGEDGKVGKGGG